ncbi:hypothetical protein [Streptomyces lushanensis]|uniref:hypothetical protein n=1 Tax=Streptomyces lushanensis TaxID=1434255 RepID=UPI00114CA820|nr:hypothetical protein [Streptomyces lushanensis]
MSAEAVAVATISDLVVLRQQGLNMSPATGALAVSGLTVAGVPTQSLGKIADVVQGIRRYAGVEPPAVRVEHDLFVCGLHTVNEPELHETESVVSHVLIHNRVSLGAFFWRVFVEPVIHGVPEMLGKVRQGMSH